MRHALPIMTVGLVCRKLAAIITTLAEWSTAPAVESVKKRRHGRYVAALV